MSYQSDEKTKHRICRMYQLRICTRGKTCPDAHPGEEDSDYDDDCVEKGQVPTGEHEEVPPDTPICRYYLQRTCRRGDSCPFFHPDPESQSDSEHELENTYRIEEPCLENDLLEEKLSAHYKEVESTQIMMQSKLYDGMELYRKRTYDDMHPDKHKTFEDMQFSKRSKKSFRELSPKSKSSLTSSQNSPPLQSKRESSQQSDPEEKTGCKYFVRGLCKRGDKCPFIHVKPDMNTVFETKHWLKFCKKYRLFMCDGNDCSFLHISSEDEHLYKTTGIISGNALGQAIRKALLLDVPLNDKKPACKENLDGDCKIMNCPFRHLSQEEFSYEVLKALQIEFQTIFGPCVEGVDLSETQKIVIQKLLTPALQEVPLALPILQEFPAAAPIMPQMPVWPPLQLFGPLQPSEIQPATSDVTENIDKVLIDKLRLANLQIGKENKKHIEHIRVLDDENCKMFKALDPEQTANDLDDIRLNLLEVFEAVNWKSNLQLMENTQDYQHKKSIEVAPEYPNVEGSIQNSEQASISLQSDDNSLGNICPNDDDNYDTDPMEVDYPEGDDQSSKLFVGGLSYKTTEESLKAYFEQYGDTEECFIKRDRKKHRSKGYGFVVFAKPSTVKAVLKIPQHMLDGRVLNVGRADLRVESSKFSKEINESTAITSSSAAGVENKEWDEVDSGIEKINDIINESTAITSSLAAGVENKEWDEVDSRIEKINDIAHFPIPTEYPIPVTGDAPWNKTFGKRSLEQQLPNMDWVFERHLKKINESTAGTSSATDAENKECVDSGNEGINDTINGSPTGTSSSAAAAVENEEWGNDNSNENIDDIATEYPVPVTGDGPWNKTCEDKSWVFDKYLKLVNPRKSTAKRKRLGPLGESSNPNSQNQNSKDSFGLDPCKIFVGGLTSADKTSVGDYFKKYGEIVKIKCRNKYGFITFAEPSSVSDVLQNMPHKINDHEVFVKQADNRPKGTGKIEDKDQLPSIYNRVYVGNLNKTTTENELQTYFSAYGEVEEVVIKKNKKEVSRGFGFVTFTEPAVAEDVVSQSPHVIGESSVEVKPPADSGKKGSIKYVEIKGSTKEGEPTSDGGEEDTSKVAPGKDAKKTTQSVPFEEIQEEVDLLCAKELGFLDELNEDNSI